MGFPRLNWRTALVALIIGPVIEGLILWVIVAESAPSWIEPGRIAWESFKWTQEPSWHVLSLLLPLLPSYFERYAYLMLVVLQAMVFAILAYLLLRFFRKKLAATP
jgi:hypothetical protein